MSEPSPSRTMTIGMRALSGIARRRLGVTRRELGERLGRDASNLVADNPRLDLAIRLAEALDWPLATVAAAVGDTPPARRRVDDPVRVALDAMVAGDPCRAARCARRVARRVARSVARSDTRFGPQSGSRLASHLGSEAGGQGRARPDGVASRASEIRALLLWSTALRELERESEASALAGRVIEIARRGDAWATMAARQLRETIEIESAIRDPTLGPISRLIPGLFSSLTAGKQLPVGAARRRSKCIDDPTVAWLLAHVEPRSAWTRRLACAAPRSARRWASCAWLMECAESIAHEEADADVARQARRSAPSGRKPMAVGAGWAEARIGAALTVVEAVLLRQWRADAVDPAILRELSRLLVAPLDAAFSSDSAWRWCDRMRVVRAEARRRRLVARMTGTAGTWLLADAQCSMLGTMLGRFPRFRHIGLSLLADAPTSTMGPMTGPTTRLGRQVGATARRGGSIGGRSGRRSRSRGSSRRDPR